MEKHVIPGKKSDVVFKKDGFIRECIEKNIPMIIEVTK